MSFFVYDYPTPSPVRYVPVAVRQPQPNHGYGFDFPVGDFGGQYRQPASYVTPSPFDSAFDSFFGPSQARHAPQPQPQSAPRAQGCGCGCRCGRQETPAVAPVSASTPAYVRVPVRHPSPVDQRQVLLQQLQEQQRQAYNQQQQEQRRIALLQQEQRRKALLQQQQQQQQREAENRAAREYLRRKQQEKARTEAAAAQDAFGDVVGDLFELIGAFVGAEAPKPKPASAKASTACVRKCPVQKPANATVAQKSPCKPCKPAAATGATPVAHTHKQAGDLVAALFGPYVQVSVSEEPVKKEEPKTETETKTKTHTNTNTAKVEKEGEKVKIAQTPAEAINLINYLFGVDVAPATTPKTEATEPEAKTVPVNVEVENEVAATESAPVQTPQEQPDEVDTAAAVEQSDETTVAPSAPVADDVGSPVATDEEYELVNEKEDISEGELNEGAQSEDEAPEAESVSSEESTGLSVESSVDLEDETANDHIERAPVNGDVPVVELVPDVPQTPIVEEVHTADSSPAESENETEAVEESAPATETAKTVPEVSIDDSEDKYVVSLKLPGYAKDKISLQVLKKRVIIDGHLKKRIVVHGTEEGNEFSEVLDLPSWAKTKNVRAKHIKDTLTITVPKASKKATKIEIKSE
eukprot:GFYU01000221.1.p1 GENE.GFYU01000221.1~~GFYU01000221.1.p1  ORF type:complete len:639 (+),score=239.34 GFYU01000221.1:72-1988(+)